MNFFTQAGKMALGSRIRYVADKITTDAAAIYDAYGIKMNPKWFPVFFTLSQTSETTVTVIASQIGHSHVSVSKIIKEMGKAGLLIEKSDARDRRRTLIALSKLGHQIAKSIERQYQDVTAAIEELSSEATHDLWAALEEWDYLLSQKSLLKRVMEKKRNRESSEVKIETYKPKYKEAFRELNREWITTYFRMEKPDIEALDNPKKYILDRGGEIFVATVNDEPVGVCAMIPMSRKIYELAKMAVAPKARGKHIGWLLGQAVIKKAKELKADRLYLESNTILKPAIGLYKKLGFKKIVGPPTPYERCNIQMELDLKNTH